MTTVKNIAQKVALGTALGLGTLGITNQSNAAGDGIKITHTKKLERLLTSEQQKRQIGLTQTQATAWEALALLLMTGTVVGAGAVITKDVRPYTIVGGVPAKEIGLRCELNE